MGHYYYTNNLRKMSTTSMILLLVTVTMVTASPANERNLLADAVGKMKASQNAMDLIVNFNDLADKYVCSLTGAKAQRECPGIQDYSIELHLWLEISTALKLPITNTA